MAHRNKAKNVRARGQEPDHALEQALGEAFQEYDNVLDQVSPDQALDQASEEHVETGSITDERQGADHAVDAVSAVHKGAESMSIKRQETDQTAAADEPAEQHIFEDGNMSSETIESIKMQTVQEMRDILQFLEKNHSGITEGVATAVGAGTGAAGSVAALSALGTVSGLSAAGVTSGLAAAGGLVGGGMLVGIGVLAAPVAALGFLGYGLASKLKKTKNSAALGLAVTRIYAVRARLIQHEAHFREELAHIKTTLELLTHTKPA